MQRPAAPQHRCRAENHRQPRSSELAAVSSMVPSSDSGPCVTRRRPPVVAEMQSMEERAPKAGTSESDDQAAESTRPEEPAAAEAEKKKNSAASGGGGGCGAMEPVRRPTVAEESARERLKRHRTEMAGRVRIPDMWGQERLLKDWVDCAVFDRPLAATAGLLNARDALVAECVAARRPAAGRPLRVQNGCS